LHQASGAGTCAMAGTDSDADMLCTTWDLPAEVGSCGWYTGALGLDGAIYCAPSRSGRVLRIMPVGTQGTGPREMRAELIGDDCTGSYSGVVPGPDGNLYCIPQGALQVMRIIPDEQRTELIGQVFESLRLTYFGQGVCGLDGCIYCVPRGPGMQVLRIDTKTLTTGLIGDMFPGDDNWSGGVRGPDGRIYCVPANAAQFLCVDPASSRTYLVGQSLGWGGFKYTGGVLAKDGCIYCCPRGASRVLKLDPARGHHVEFIGETYHGSLNKWVNGVLGPDDRIYCPPADARKVLCIDPAEGSTKLVGIDCGSTDIYKWCSGVLAHDGCIYAVPYQAPCVLLLKTAAPPDWRHPVGEPWVPHRHHSFASSSRQHAWQLLCIGYQLAHSGPFRGREHAFLDAWRSIISLVVFRIPF